MGLVVHVDIYETVVDEVGDGGVVADEVGKLQTPGTPVAAHLADNVFPFFLCLVQSLVNLHEGIDAVVINPFQWRLSLCLC